MSKAEILEELRDVNYTYNNCTKHDQLSYMLDEFEKELKSKMIDEFASRLKNDVFIKQVTFFNKLCMYKIIDTTAEEMKEEIICHD